MHGKQEHAKDRLGWGGRLICAIFGVFFTCFAIAGLWFTFSNAIATIDINVFWQEQNCTISDSSVRHLPNEYYAPHVAYFYNYNGVTYHSTDIYPTDITFGTHREFSEYEKAANLSTAFESGNDYKCIINPRDPSASALLAPDILQFLVQIIVVPAFSLLAMLFGVLSAAISVFSGRWAGHLVQKDALLQKTRPTRNLYQRYIRRAVITGIFAMVVAAICAYMLKETIELVQPREWKQTQCVVEHLGIRQKEHYDEHSNSISIRYYPNILYRYRVNGVTYRSNRLHHMPRSIENGSYHNIENLLHNVEKQDVISCFYDATKPQYAVLTLSNTFPYLLVAATIIAMCMSVGLIWWCVKNVRKAYNV